MGFSTKLGIDGIQGDIQLGVLHIIWKEEHMKLGRKTMLKRWKLRVQVLRSWDTLRSGLRRLDNKNKMEAMREAQAYAFSKACMASYENSHVHT